MKEIFVGTAARFDEAKSLCSIKEIYIPGKWFKSNFLLFWCRNNYVGRINLFLGSFLGFGMEYTILIHISNHVFKRSRSIVTTFLFTLLFIQAFLLFGFFSVFFVGCNSAICHSFIFMQE